MKKQVNYYYEGVETLTENFFLSMIEERKILMDTNETISKDLMVSPTYVSRLVKKLKDKGLIDTNLYQNRLRAITLTTKAKTI